jgi:hypothetical protein
MRNFERSGPSRSEMPVELTTSAKRTETIRRSPAIAVVKPTPITKENLYWAGCATLISSRQHADDFESAFESYFSSPQLEETLTAPAQRLVDRFGGGSQPSLEDRQGKTDGSLTAVVLQGLECAVGKLQEQIVGIPDGEVGHLPHIALGDEEIDEAVIIDVLELRVPGRAGQDLAARIGAVGGHAPGEGNVGIGRARATLLGYLGQHLQLVVGHAGQEIGRVAIEIEIVAGDPHAPYAQTLPAFLLGVEAGFRARFEPP